MSSTILTVYDLSKSYNIYPIFEGVGFTLNAGEKAALVGPNGVGKSTLLKIIAGQETASGGSVVKAKTLRVVYVPQEAASSFASESDLSYSPEDTLYNAMLDAVGPVRSLQERLRELEAEMAGVKGGEWDRLMAQYEVVTHRFEMAGGYDLEHRVEQVLGGLGFNPEQYEQTLSTMSGGQRTRAALARALLADPDLLLLDEPTNHLDIEAIEWLESFLLQWRGTLLAIAHDRRFLNKVTSRTLDMEFTKPKSFTWYSKSGELRDGGEVPAYSRLQDYPAGYEKYLQLKAERYERMLAEYEAQQETISRTWDFIRRYKEGQKKRQAFGRLKRLQRAHNEGLLDRPAERAQLRLTLRAHVRSGQSVFEAEDLVIGYPGKVLARCPDLEIERGERVALIGPNGVGKTTLLRTMMGQHAPLAGHLELGHNVRFGYYAQAHEGLDARNTVLEEVRSVRNMTEEAARDLLGKMLFSGDNVYKQVGDLSGGERSRVALTKLTLTDANFLILDEPTNHLDLDAQEALTEVLTNYDGTILFVSHDRAFIDDLASQVWVMDNGTLAAYDGNYTDYLAEKARREAVAAGAVAVSTNGKAQPAAAVKVDTREQSKAAQRQNRAGERERARLLKRKEAAEGRVSELEERLNSCSDKLTRATEQRDLDEIVKLGTEYAALEEELDRAYAEWNSLEEEVQAEA
ncbi:MAG TPA: ABC-F family ATP-binding cassette domain-containing protein [Chloroflexia bacterium]|nr:ABC-F family ATP-binding cassette domain-containing protein [Chloroflexia bacterium]